MARRSQPSRRARKANGLYDSAAIDGNKVSLVLTIDYEGQPMTISYVGTVADDSINGSADFGGLAQGSFSAKRKEAPKP